MLHYLDRYKNQFEVLPLNNQLFILGLFPDSTEISPLCILIKLFAQLQYLYNLNNVKQLPVNLIPTIYKRQSKKTWILCLIGNSMENPLPQMK